MLKPYPVEHLIITKMVVMAHTVAMVVVALNLTSMRVLMLITYQAVDILLIMEVNLQTCLALRCCVKFVVSKVMQQPLVIVFHTPQILPQHHAVLLEIPGWWTPGLLTILCPT